MAYLDPFAGLDALYLKQISLQPLDVKPDTFYLFIPTLHKPILQLWHTKSSAGFWHPHEHVHV